MKGRRVVVAAAVLAALFGAVHALGWRSAVGVLSGSVTSGGTALEGLIYAAAYFGFVIIVPILLLSIPIGWLLGYKRSR